VLNASFSHEPRPNRRVRRFDCGKTHRFLFREFFVVRLVIFKVQPDGVFNICDRFVVAGACV